MIHLQTLKQQEPWHLHLARITCSNQALQCYLCQSRRIWRSKLLPFGSLIQFSRIWRITSCIHSPIHHHIAFVCRVNAISKREYLIPRAHRGSCHHTLYRRSTTSTIHFDTHRYFASPFPFLPSCGWLIYWVLSHRKSWEGLHPRPGINQFSTNFIHSRRVRSTFTNPAILQMASDINPKVHLCEQPFCALHHFPVWC